MKRHAPEELEEDPGPLFRAAITSIDTARARRDAGMANAATSADARGGGWSERFVEALRLYARSHATFMAEDILALCPPPAFVTGRAVGPLMKRAEKLGYIEHAGYAPARTSNLSPKSVWKSRLYVA